MITKEQALTAVDDLDDFARMGGVTAIGANAVLAEFIDRKPLVVAAAIKFNSKDGTVVCSVPRPGRHHNVIHACAGLGMKTPIIGTQGFLDADGQFLNRTEAMRRVIECKQPFKPSGSPDSLELFSEDVW